MADTQYILPNDIGVSSLDCREAFRLLSPTERLYAHHLSRAAWYGGLAVLLQTSPEAPYIYALLSRLFRAQDPDQLRQHALAEGLTEEEYQVSSQANLHFLSGFQVVGARRQGGYKRLSLSWD